MNKHSLTRLLFEHGFWLQILGDHSRFIAGALAEKETAELERANHFIAIFDTLLANVKQCHSAEDIHQLTQVACQEVAALREFKLHLLRRHLTQGIDFHLSPTFVNHMVNELDEYRLVLECFLNQGEVPQSHPVHYHEVWLTDAVGHAATLYCELDETEAELKEKSKCFQHAFENMQRRALEYAGYLRTGLSEFPALDRFNCLVDKEMNLFQLFLAELLDLRVCLAALGTLSPLVPDHMYREECYYLTKLALGGSLPMPNCDPAKPRIKIG